MWKFVHFYRNRVIINLKISILSDNILHFKINHRKYLKTLNLLILDFTFLWFVFHSFQANVCEQLSPNFCLVVLLHWLSFGLPLGWTCPTSLISMDDALFLLLKYQPFYLQSSADLALLVKLFSCSGFGWENTSSAFCSW